MLKYLFRPFVFLLRELCIFLLALLLIFRTPLLLLLSLFISGFLPALYVAIFIHYYKDKVDSVSNFNINLFNYVEAHKWYFLLAFLFVFLFIWSLLERTVPNSRDIPRASSMRLRKGMMLPLGKQSDTFIWKTSDRYKAIVVSSPYQGIYVEGSVGAGKSASVVEPFIYQAARQGFSGFLYDFKGNPPTLSSILYGALTEHKCGVHFAHINLADPTISHRSNPLCPVYLPSKIHAHEYASAILKNLNKEWATKLDFWAENAIAYLSAIIWYLKVHYPSFCSLPHAMLLALEPPERSLSLLGQDEEVKRMIGPINVVQQQQANRGSKRKPQIFPGGYFLLSLNI